MSTPSSKVRNDVVAKTNVLYVFEEGMYLYRRCGLHPADGSEPE